jgi:hypothetical protein
LPLHGGKAPPWLVQRMQGLSEAIVEVILDEHGSEGFFAKLADPYWFQAFGCVLGYDWHSSGVTTVVTGVLKSVLKPEEHGVAVAGGKGKASKRAPNEIAVLGKRFGLSEEQVHRLCYSSRISAKVDNAAIQAGYPLYHHAFFLEREGKWLIIQQGVNTTEMAARRYHWYSDHVKSYVVEPHDAIVGDKTHERVLNMTAKESESARRIAVDLVNDGPDRLRRLVTLAPTNQATLTNWIGGNESKMLRMPWRIDWKALKKAYEIKPQNYEELLALRGIGPVTVRGLAFVSEMVYGERPSWRDPVRFSFAYGGKDGVPFPVNLRAMDQSIQFLQEALEEAKIGDRGKLQAFNRLRSLNTTDMACTKRVVHRSFLQNQTIGHK